MQRVLYYDKLNVISCMAVVCLHANSFVHTFAKDEWWWLRVLVEVVFFFAVPIFFMLSGATLIDYRQRYTTKEFYHKRFLKTVIPFVFWGFVFYTLNYLNGHKIEGWQKVVTNITTGRIPLTNYWFFIPLFMIYLFMPFISLMVANMSKKQIGALCFLLVIFQSFVPTLYQIMGLEFVITLPIGGYVMFLLLGYYIAHSDIERNKLFGVIVGGGKFGGFNNPLSSNFFCRIQRTSSVLLYGFIRSISPYIYISLYEKKKLLLKIY